MFIDFETRSVLDLADVGLHNYALHPTTQPWCMAYGLGDEEFKLWWFGEPLPEIVRDHVELGGIIVAHNATFEWKVWNYIMAARHGWPELDINQCRCTMAMAYAMALPGKLADAAAALGLEAQKDMKGHRLMLQMCRPRSTNPLTWWDDDDRKQRLGEYCVVDTQVEREMYRRMRKLSDSEQRLWGLDHRINERGVFIDRPTIRKAVEVCNAEKLKLDTRIQKATDGFVSSASEVARLTKWVRAQGIPIPAMAKADVLEALEDDNLPANVQAALRVRQEAGKTSVAKLVTMLANAGPDNRVRHTLQYHGAATGRWAGRVIQLQNFPRPRKGIGPNDVFDIIGYLNNAEIETLDMFYGPVLDAVADSLRGMLMAAPHHNLIAADFSAIESRVLAWLSGQEDKLDIFRGHGKIYEFVASGIYRKDIELVDEYERFVGKVAELALGYGGGVGAFQQMAKGYGLKVADSRAEEIKLAWRESNPNTVRYWYALNDAAMQAVDHPGVITYAGSSGRRIAYGMNGSFLWCKLPSGRALCYPYPKLEEVETPWGQMKLALTYMYVDSFTKKWVRGSTHGGVLAENVTQAVSRDLLADSIMRVERNRFKTVFHVHDEIVCEVPEDFSDLEMFEKLVSTTEAWAKDLPVKAKGWIGRRYRK